MSILDTLSMLEKRAAGEEPEAKYSEQELRLFAIEMQKQAGFLGDAAAKGLYGLGAVAAAPFTLGEKGMEGAFGVYDRLPHTGGRATRLLGRGLKGVGNLAADTVSSIAAFPLDHPGAALTGALTIGFPLLDAKSRADDIKQKGKVPNLAGPRLR